MAKRGGVEGGGLPQHRADGAQSLVYPRGQLDGARGGAHLRGGAHEEGIGEEYAQALEGVADGRLGAAEADASAGEALFAVDAVEDVEQVEVGCT